MAKKIYIQAKKDIEALLQENGDSEICAIYTFDSRFYWIWLSCFTVARLRKQL